MRIPTRTHLVLFSLAIVVTCLTTNTTADTSFNTIYIPNESMNQWVCDYTRGKNDVLLLRCDDRVGLLYDHMMLKDGDESKTTQYIPIWRRAHNDAAAINLVRTLLCRQESDCSVEMSQAWASNY